MKPAVVITMGGVGRRFREAGYDVPKYRILARGASLFDWSIRSLQTFIDEGSPFVFVVQSADEAKAFIAERARALGLGDFEIVEIDHLTDGQATTVLCAAPALPNAGSPVAVFNIDTHVAPHAMAASAVRGDGWVPCFIAPGDKWSFARADAGGRILEMREKVRISENATLGLYYFSSFDLYAHAYRRLYSEGAAPEAGEKYVAPMYNVLIGEGLQVFMHPVAAADVIALGTPEDLSLFDPAASPQRVL